MHENVFDVVVLFKIAEAHMSLVDFFAIFETGKINRRSRIELVMQVLGLG